MNYTPPLKGYRVNDRVHLARSNVDHPTSVYDRFANFDHQAFDFGSCIIMV